MVDDMDRETPDRVEEAVAHALRVVGPPEDVVYVEESPAGAD
jgi:hypothetical protein